MKDRAVIRCPPSGGILASRSCSEPLCRISVTRQEHLVVLVASAGLTILLTWPLAGGFTTLGRSDSGDARHGLWNVAWVAHALTTDPTHLFDANIFDPLPATLAYSEANIVAGVMALPVWITTGNPYAAMNSVSVLSFVLAAWITYALVKRITASRLGAAFAAIAFAFCPFIFSHFAHIQLLMSWTVPLVLLRMHAFVDTPRWPQSFLLGASMAIAGLACGYYGIFAGLAAGLGVLWFGLTNRRRDVTYWLGGLAAAAVAVAVVAPFFLPYVGIQAEGFGRTLAEARPNSADWRAYLASPMVLHAWMLPWLGTWKEVLFPGFLPIAFAGAGIAAVFGFSPAGSPTMTRSIAGFYGVLGGLAFWASFGPDAGLYAVLHDWLPVFSLLRAPARLGLIVMLALAVLAAAGLATLQGRLPAGLRRAFGPVVIAATLAGSFVPSLNLVPAPAVPEAYRRLAALPRAPVAEFPFFREPLERHRHTEYMLMSIFHWQPLVNGYSDHIPARAFEDMATLSTFPDSEAWGALEAHGVRYVVIHWRSFDHPQIVAIGQRRAEWESRLRPIVSGDGVALYERLR